MECDIVCMHEGLEMVEYAYNTSRMMNGSSKEGGKHNNSSRGVMGLTSILLQKFQRGVACFWSISGV